MIMQCISLTFICTTKTTCFDMNCGGHCSYLTSNCVFDNSAVV